MNIHFERRKRLVEVAMKAVSQMQVDNGIFLQPQSASLLYDAEKELDSNTKTLLRNIISDRPFSGFVVGYLDDHLRRTFKYESSGAKPLVGLKGFEDAAVVAKEVVDAFCSLPWTYTFIYPLPLKASFAADAPDEDKLYPITQTLSLVRPGPLFSQRYPLAANTFGEMLRGGPFPNDRPLSWNASTLYLAYEAKGFLTRFFSTQLANEARLVVREVAGILEAADLIKYDYAASLAAMSLWDPYAFRGNRWIYSYLERNGAWESAASVELDTEHAERLGALQWTEDDEIQEDDWETWIKGLSRWVGPAFAENKGAALLRRSCQWHFDSNCGSNPLLQFVQATVAIEILLGDKSSSDVIGLGELLANRCAYSLAESASERHELLTEFRDAYQTRSAIVHRGKATLSDEETNQLWQLRYLGRRLIIKELKMMRSRKRP